MAGEMAGLNREPIEPDAPGSESAIDRGCLCPSLDNGHGRGRRRADGDVEYWITAGCPLHGFQTTRERWAH